MDIKYTKLSGTGNTFVVIDNREELVSADDKQLWIDLCQNKESVDGVLLLEKSQKHDFRMRIINADGTEASMCGNGGRILLYFADQIGIPMNKKYLFETMNGVYEGEIASEGVTSLKMTELYDVGAIDLSKFDDYDYSLYLNTGAPHAVFQVDNIEAVDVVKAGRAVRYDEMFEGGTNVNFFQVESEGEIVVRTYEKGVEDETGSCGTGATAAAIAYARQSGWKGAVKVHAKGGELVIGLDEKLETVTLCGKVEKLSSGSFSI